MLVAAFTANGYARAVAPLRLALGATHGVLRARCCFRLLSGRPEASAGLLLLPRSSSAWVPVLGTISAHIFRAATGMGMPFVRGGRGPAAPALAARVS